jgi:NAD(P)-dependent dehydrogenase (short-subunit alcohol dehydrogenase family)
MNAENTTMDGKICMITGATSGIGYVTAREIARQGATLVIVGRNEQKCVETVNTIKQQTGNEAVEWMLADLSVQQDIHRLADLFTSRYSRLDVLVNNAGALFMQRQESADGIEMTFALNHLNYMLLTNLLLDTIKASAPARIVNVSSDAHRAATMNFDDPQLQQGYSGWKAYNQSKLANLLFTYELARQLEGTGVTVNALHPGFVASGFGMNNGWVAQLLRPLVKLVAKTSEQGARTSIYLATSPDVAGTSGKYFSEQQEVNSSQASYDADAQQRLWELSAEMTGLHQLQEA